MKPTQKSPDKHSSSIHHLFRAYHQSHVNRTNQIIHYFCVPLIFWSVSALLWLIKIPGVFWQGFQLNLAIVSIVAILIYYLIKSRRVFFVMMIFSLMCLWVNYWLSLYTDHLLLIAISVFVVAWVGQFIGHHIEGKKPSFYQDLQFLLIGPAWVVFKLFGGRP